MFSTTVYEPVEDGHRLINDPDIPNSRCTVCGGNPWDAQHRLIEEHRADVYAEGPGLYCVEASDDHERSYTTNGLRWSDVEDAKRWASGLAMRWFGCTNIRLRACDEQGQPTGDTVHQTL